MRRWTILACLAMLAFYQATAIAGWWTQPIAVFSGRREFWWDAEDFAVFFAAGTLIARGDPGAVYDAGAHASIQLPLLVGHSEPLGFYNPPLFGLLFAPLSWLPYEHAFRLWTAVNVTLMVVLCALLWRIAEPVERVYRVAIVAGFLTMYPLPFGLRLGQFSLILAVAWAVAYVLLRSGKPRAAGFALTPLLIKPELLIPVTIFFAWKREWQTLRALLPVSGAAIALSVAMIGPVGAWDYGWHIAEAARDGTGNMYGWNGLLASTFAPDEPGRMMAYATPLSLLTVASTALLWRGPLEPAGAAFPIQWLALTLATLLADAHLYLQDLVIVAAPAVAAFAAATDWRRSTAGAGLVVGWLILGLGSVPAAFWGINLFALYMLCWLVTLVAWSAYASLGRQSREQALAPPAWEARAA